jgi:hypothetical protein
LRFTGRSSVVCAALVCGMVVGLAVGFRGLRLDLGFVLRDDVLVVGALAHTEDQQQDRSDDAPRGRLGPLLADRGCEEADEKT